MVTGACSCSECGQQGVIGKYYRGVVGELHKFLADDHDRLDRLLQAVVRSDGTIDSGPYVEFRAGLLRHIAIEERILFPEGRRREGETELMRQLHRDHAALAALLVPPPTATEIGRIREILTVHNELEEEANGLYEWIETLAGAELAEMMVRVHAIPEARLAAHFDTPITRSSIEQLLREADEGRKAFRP
jgi:hypothetical protein